MTSATRRRIVSILEGTNSDEAGRSIRLSWKAWEFDDGRVQWNLEDVCKVLQAWTAKKAPDCVSVLIKKDRIRLREFFGTQSHLEEHIFPSRLAKLRSGLAPPHTAHIMQTYTCTSKGLLYWLQFSESMRHKLRDRQCAALAHELFFTLIVAEDSDIHEYSRRRADAVQSSCCEGPVDTQGFCTHMSAVAPAFAQGAGHSRHTAVRIMRGIFDNWELLTECLAGRRWRRDVLVHIVEAIDNAIRSERFKVLVGEIPASRTGSKRQRDEDIKDFLVEEATPFLTSKCCQ